MIAYTLYIDGSKLYRTNGLRVEVFDHIDPAGMMMWVGIDSLPPDAKPIIPECSGTKFVGR